MVPPPAADLLEVTADLVDRPSESFEEGPLVGWLEDELRTLSHLEVTRVGDNLVARTTLGRPQRLILAGHTDTVPANGNGKARIDGDILWGLGSADMKGGLAIFLDVARRVPQPTIDLTFVFYAREEVAQEHSGLIELIEARPDLVAADCAILGEPTAGAIEAGCQGTLRAEITLKGARAHTARPWMGRNAVHRLAPLLAEIAGYEPRTPDIDGCRYREALQAVSVEGGVAGNVVPDSASLRIHHRYAPDRTAEEAESFVRNLVAAHLDDGDRLTIVDASPACAPSLRHPVLDRLVQDNDLEVRAKLGWTDVARFAELGIPATNYGPGDATVAHTADEHLHRSRLERCHESLVRLVTTTW